MAAQWLLLTALHVVPLAVLGALIEPARFWLLLPAAVLAVAGATATVLFPCGGSVRTAGRSPTRRCTSAPGSSGRSGGSPRCPGSRPWTPCAARWNSSSGSPPSQSPTLSAKGAVGSRAGPRAGRRPRRAAHPDHPRHPRRRHAEHRRPARRLAPPRSPYGPGHRPRRGGGCRGRSHPVTLGLARWSSLPVAVLQVLAGALLVIGVAAGADRVRWHRTRYRVGQERVDTPHRPPPRQAPLLARSRIRTVDLTAKPDAPPPRSGHRQDRHRRDRAPSPPSYWTLSPGPRANDCASSPGARRHRIARRPPRGRTGRPGPPLDPVTLPVSFCAPPCSAGAAAGP